MRVEDGEANVKCGCGEASRIPWVKQTFAWHGFPETLKRH